MNAAGKAQVGPLGPRVIFNLGCGLKTSDHPDITNVDWNYYLKLSRSRIGRTLGRALFKGDRLQRLNSVPANVLVHDLAKGIPADDGSVDAVYHSHMLEHLDRDLVPGFLSEVHRVLRPGGVHRIVVPDLVVLVGQYSANLANCRKTGDTSGHDRFVEALYEQSVRKASGGRTSKQRRVVTAIERVVVGDARRRGETHQWMYDEFNLGSLLVDAGYADIRVQTYDSSSISGWSTYGLDEIADGAEYKPGSLYVEALRPE